MKCSKCNNEVKEGKYCKYCGNRLDKSKDDTYFIIGILLIIFFPIVGIIFWSSWCNFTASFPTVLVTSYAVVCILRGAL